MEFVFQADPEIGTWWSLDKLDRESSFLNMIEVLDQTIETTQSKIEDWMLPSEVTLRPVMHGE